jgi:hypothetical protein
LEFGDEAAVGGGEPGAGAAEAPFGVGHFADAAFLLEAGGVVFGVEEVEEELEFGGIVAGEEDGGGAEAVLEGVAGGGGLAGGGARAGGVLGVGLVGGAAGIGYWHDLSCLF